MGCTRSRSSSGKGAGGLVALLCREQTSGGLPGLPLAGLTLKARG